MFSDPFPDFIKGEDPDSFAGFTIRSRLPEIISLVLNDQNYSSLQYDRLMTLKESLPASTLHPSWDSVAGDWGRWEKMLNPYVERNWLEVPFFFAEMYFYRCLLEAIGYF